MMTIQETKTHLHKARFEDRSTSNQPMSGVIFFVTTSLLISAVTLVIMIFTRLEVFSANAHIAFAMFLGVTFTIVVGVGLMSLVFYSDRSGRDETVIQGQRQSGA